MSAAFDRLARPAILMAARSDRLRRSIGRLPVTSSVVRRFVPGETVADALDAVAGLHTAGLSASVDHLGEDVTDTAGAEANVAAYLELLDAIGRHRDAAPPNGAPFEVSVKLSALGQALDRDGDKIALENTHVICSKAREVGAWVTVDAEERTSVDSRLNIVTELRADFDWLGTVAQAYLHRTENDCRWFAATGARIRLCKGAYDEPASVAFRDRAEVTESYLRCLRVLMAGRGYPMVATHDPEIIAAVPQLATETGRGRADFEYQMLYGIRSGEQLRLAATGQQVRVYLPFGTEWYGYFARRLAERPANLAFFLRALARG